MSIMLLRQAFQSGNTLTVPAALTSFDKVFGPFPTSSDVTGDTDLNGWIVDRIGYIQDTLYSNWVVNDTGSTSSWYYDPALYYLGRYKVFGVSGDLTKAKAFADMYVNGTGAGGNPFFSTPSSPGTGSNLFENYQHGAVCCYLLDGSISNIVSYSQSESYSAQGFDKYFWEKFMSPTPDTIAPIGDGTTDPRSCTRLCQQALWNHILGNSFTAANVYSVKGTSSGGAKGPTPYPSNAGSWLGVAQSCVDAILANQDSGGGWKNAYTGYSAFGKIFMEFFLCHCLYDYLRISADTSRQTTIITAIKNCADVCYSQAYVSANNDFWYVRPSSATDQTGQQFETPDLSPELAWPYALLAYLGYTTLGSTTYSAFARTLIQGYNSYIGYHGTGGTSGGNWVNKAYAKQFNEGVYRWHQTAYFMTHTASGDGHANSVF